MSLDSWSGMEKFLTGKNQEKDEWLHFVSQSTPDYIWEHRQNIYEAKNNYD